MQARDLDIEKVKSQRIKISQHKILSQEEHNCHKEEAGSLGVPFLFGTCNISSVTREGRFDLGGMRLLLRPFPPVEGSRVKR